MTRNVEHVSQKSDSPPLDDGSVDYETARQMLEMLDEAGVCTNCGHTKEYDVQDVRAGLGSCRPEKNLMEHTCPPDGRLSEVDYEALVMEPIRERLKELTQW